MGDEVGHAPAGEGQAIAHVTRDGHACGGERADVPDALMTFATAILREEDADEVFITPEETFVEHGDEIVRYRNSPEMIEALDRYLLTGEVSLGSFRLLPP